MAKLNGTVQGWPEVDKTSFENYEIQSKQQEKAFAKLQKEANKATPANPVGAIIKFGVADGHALYRVDSIKPLTVSHIPYQDAWEIDYPYIRGLTVNDVREMVQSQIAINKLFGGTKRKSK